MRGATGLLQEAERSAGENRTEDRGWCSRASHRQVAGTVHEHRHEVEAVQGRQQQRQRNMTRDEGSTAPAILANWPDWAYLRSAGVAELRFSGLGLRIESRLKIDD